MPDSKFLDKKTKLNFIFVIFSEVVTVMTPLVLAPYLTRVLGKTKIGTFDYVVSNSSYFIILAQLGLDVYGQREIAKYSSDKKQMSTVYKRVLSLRRITFSIAILAYLFFAFTFGKEYRTVYLIYCIYFIGVSIDISWLYKGLEKFGVVTFRNIAIKVITFVLVFVLVKNQNDFLKYVFIYSTSTLISNMSMYIGEKKVIDFNVSFPFRDLANDFFQSLSLFVPQIAIVISCYFDKTMIGVFHSVDEVAYYSQAEKIITVLLTVVTSFSTIMLSKNAYLGHHHQKDELFNNMMFSIGVASTFSLPMIAGIACISKYFIPLYYGPGFEKSILIFPALSIMLFTSGISDVFGRQYLSATNKQKYYSFALFGGMIVNVALNALLIPAYASFGATIATIVSQLVIVIVLILFIRKEVKISQLFAHAWKPFFASIIMYFTIQFLNHIICNFNNLVVICMDVIVGLTTYFFINLLLKNETLLCFFRK